jgi:hypothetical protein
MSNAQGITTASSADLFSLRELLESMAGDNQIGKSAEQWSLTRSDR